MNPGAAKLLDFVFTLALAGVERQLVLDEIQAKADAGATEEEITAHLRKMALASEAEALAAINAAKLAAGK